MALADTWFLRFVVAFSALVILVVALRWSQGPGAVVAASSPNDRQVRASLLDVTPSASSMHNYRVCLSPTWVPITTQWTCREVAYLAGVPWHSGSVSVRLVWASSSRLEVHYPQARSADLYVPTYVPRLNSFWFTFFRPTPVSIINIYLVLDSDAKIKNE
jgi:hypothetical protein